MFRGKSYAGEFKQKVIERMRNEGLSFRQTAREYGLDYKTVIEGYIPSAISSPFPSIFLISFLSNFLGLAQKLGVLFSLKHELQKGPARWQGLFLKFIPPIKAADC